MFEDDNDDFVAVLEDDDDLLIENEDADAVEDVATADNNVDEPLIDIDAILGDDVLLPLFEMLEDDDDEEDELDDVCDCN
jgi:hypothetical protein